MNVDMKQIKVMITTKSPVVLTAENQSTVMTESRNSINGSVLRGIFAAKYIEAQKLGKTAQKDVDFRRLFFDAVRFVDAEPVLGKYRSFPLPLSLLKNKEGTKIKDVKNWIKTEKTKKELMGFKPAKGLGWLDEEGHLGQGSLNKKISLHMSRSSGEERISGKSEDGKIYNYEAISTGQKFEGYLIGSEADLSILSGLIGPEGSSCRIGRSKNTEYGECFLSLGTIENIPVPRKIPQDPSGRIWLRMETPLLFQETGMEIESAKEIISHALGRKLTGVRVWTEDGDQPHTRLFSSIEEIDRFVGIWNMRTPRRKALAAGTLFAIEKEGTWSEEDKMALVHLMYNGAGMGNPEGFGQLRFWDCGEDVTPTSCNGMETNSTQIYEIESPAVRNLAVVILKKQILSMVRNWAMEDAERATHLEGTVHMFSRLELMLGVNPEGSQRRLYEKYKEATVGKKETPFTKHLRKVLSNGMFLSEILGNKKRPYQSRMEKLHESGKRFKELLRLLGCNDIPVTDDEIFYEYWLWFFRHGRKQAVKGKQV